MDKNKWNKGRKMLLLCMAVLVVTISLFLAFPHDGWLGLLINPPRFVEIELEKVALIYFEPSDDTPEVRFRPHWWLVGTKESADDLAMRYALDLPNIDFEKNMFVVAFGSKIERLDYDENEPAGSRPSGVHIGYTLFAHEEPENIIVVYKAEKIQIMPAEFPHFMGRGRTPQWPYR